MWTTLAPNVFNRGNVRWTIGQDADNARRLATSARPTRAKSSKGIAVDKLNRDLLVAVLALLKKMRHVTASRPRSISGPRIAISPYPISSSRRRRSTTTICASWKPWLQPIYGWRKPASRTRKGCALWSYTQELPSEIQEDALRTTLCTTIGGGSTVPLSSIPDGTFEPPGPAEAPTLTPGGRFQLVRPHAKGGIGQVWVARDGELQRDVALKVIQPRYAEREDQRARFLLEAEITGNLEHPGIVPVYSLGRNAEGRPYYAMRFIRGESLSVAIRGSTSDWAEASAAGGKGTRSMWGIEFRQLLGRFLDVCDAIDYAHSRGVLHRDLKPANIMLGRYGETLVVDWGLAKVIGKNDIDPRADRRRLRAEPGGERRQRSPARRSRARRSARRPT